MEYRCVGRGEDGDGCPNRLECDDPDLTDTGWARLFGRPLGSRQYEDLREAICKECLGRAEKKRRDERNAKRRARYAARKIADVSSESEHG